MFKSFIIAVSGLSVICAVAGTVMPEGRTKKILSFCLSCAAVFLISCAVKQSFSDFKNGELFDEIAETGEPTGENDSAFEVGKFGQYSCDNEKLRIYVAEHYIARARNELKKCGIYLENAGISFGEGNEKVVPEKIIIDSRNLVIIEKNEHINISLKCREALNELFKNENISVIVNE